MFFIEQESDILAIFFYLNLKIVRLDKTIKCDITCL